MNQAKMMMNAVLLAAASLGAAIARALGGWDGALQALCIVMAVDYLSGVACALVWKKSPKSENGAFESHASIKGLLRKGAALAVVWVAYNLDVAFATDFLRNASILFFVGNDGLSIVENLGIIGLPLPPAVARAFEALRQRGEE